MACDCYSLSSLPTCSESLTLSGLTADADVYIYVQNIAGYVHRYEGTTDEEGDITLDITEPSTFYHSDSTFKIWATDQGGTQLTFTIDAEEYECLNQSFYLVSSNSEANPE
jgi:hypothetical protein